MDNDTGQCPAVFDGRSCGAPIEVLTWCRYHWRQQHEGRAFTRRKPRRANGSPSMRDSLGRKACARCKVWRPVGDYTPAPSVPDGLQPWCSPCAGDYMMVRRYGLTRADVTAMLEAQGGCAMCQTTSPRGASYRNAWHVDHDHSCCAGPRTCGACVRAVLCADCNLLIGKAGDSIRVLEQAIAYLRGHEACKP